MGDLDGDGNTDFVVVAGGQLYVWKLGIPFDPETAPWPFYQRDLANTGRVPFSPSCTFDPVQSFGGLSNAAADWGDFDQDGDQDFVLTGSNLPGQPPRVSAIYRNDGVAGYTDINAGLPGVMAGAVDWGDYDNDGDLDLALTGSDLTATRISRIYRNDSGIFVDITVGLVGVAESDVRWVDFDNDGDLDLAISGRTASGRIMAIYINTGGTFAAVSNNLPQVEKSAMDWAYVNNDLYPDLALSGNGTVGIYINNGGTGNFTNIASFLNLTQGTIDFGDYDNDGDPDLFISGFVTTTGVGVAQIHRNDGGTYVNIGAGLTGVVASDGGWFDYDNDGDLDLVYAGRGSGGNVALLYENSGGIFTDISEPLPPLYDPAVEWADHDNDGDLDLLMVGSGTTQILANPTNQ